METKLKITHILYLSHKDLRVAFFNMVNNVNKNKKILMMSKQIGNLRRIASLKYKEIIELKIKYLK